MEMKREIETRADMRRRTPLSSTFPAARGLVPDSTFPRCCLSISAS